MRSIDALSLNHREKLAISEASQLLKDQFSAARVILFGSKARGDDDEESDIDLLVLIPERVTWNHRKAINDALFDIELRHDVVISPLTTTIEEWDEGLFSVLPIHAEITERGVVT